MTEVGGEEEEASGDGKGRGRLEAAGQWKAVRWAKTLHRRMVGTLEIDFFYSKSPSYLY